MSLWDTIKRGAQGAAGVIAAPYTGGASLALTADAAARGDSSSPGDAAAGVTGGIGEAFQDNLNLGKNRADPGLYQYKDQNWGGDPGKADYFANQGLGISQGLRGQALSANDSANYAQGQMQGGYGRGVDASHGYEATGDVAREYASRGIQSNALGLAGQAAQGNAPSAAQYMMNSGMNTAMANQQAIAGGARGSGALALAGGNMAGNQAAMQSQAYNQGGQLRAQEMATARDQYGQLAGAQRGQDQSRLAQSTANTQFNANVNNSVGAQNMDRDAQYRVGMGNTSANLRGAATAAENGASNALTGAQHPYDAQLGANTTMQGLRGTSYDTNEQTKAGIMGGNADRKAAQTNKWIDAGTGLVSSLLTKK